MQQVLYCFVFYLILGAAGMAAGSRMVGKKTAEERWLKFVTYILIVLLVSASILLDYFFWLAILIALISTGELFVAAEKKPFRISLLAVFAIYVSVIAGFIYFSLRSSIEFQFFIYFLVFTFDAFSQITGQIFGRTTISSAISPGKTLEGLAGGTIFCLISAIIGASLIGEDILHAIMTGILTCAAAFTGDMLASAFKRRQGIKDYSKLLPGQGGFLDRFDSLLMASAVASIAFPALGQKL